MLGRDPAGVDHKLSKNFQSCFHDQVFNEYVLVNNHLYKKIAVPMSMSMCTVCACMQLVEVHTVYVNSNIAHQSKNQAYNLWQKVHALSKKTRAYTA